MTRKDYVRLAAGLLTARLEAADAAEERGVERATRRLADALAGDNGRFDRERFYSAAGMGEVR